MNPRLLPLALALLAAPLTAQGLTPQQVMNVRQVLDVFPSPDGHWLAYTVTQARGPDESPGPANVTAFAISLENADAKPVALPDAHGLAWQPGTGLVTWIATHDGDKTPQVFGRPVTGGDARKLAETPNGVGTYAWRPDGEAFAYTALDPETDLRRKNLERGFAPVVVDEDNRNVSLWLWDVETNKSTRLTTEGTVHDFVWSPKGDVLAVAISPHDTVDDHYVFRRLFLVTPASGQVTKLVDNPGKLGPFRWSPDGEILAYITAADRNDPDAGSIAFVTRDGSPSHQFDLLPVPSLPIWTGENSEIRDVRWLGNGPPLMLVDHGARSFVTQGGIPLNRTPLPAVESFETLPDGRWVSVASTPDHPREVFVQREVRGELERLTDSNPWLADVELGKQEIVTITARDGVPIEGLLIHPVGDTTEPTPLVIIAHGGPESHYRNGWVTRYAEPGQVLAGMGYTVWYPNYRSSTGYGVEFAKADHGDPMGREFLDHLDAIDTFADQGMIDPKRVGILGGSYGGYTAAFAATRFSERFAAAVSFVPFTDIRTKWLTTDIPYEFYFVHYEEQWPHEQPGLLADRSPLTWAPYCNTPLLLCGGDADTRVDPSQPFMLYRAINFATDAPVRYVRYPGEGHGNRTDVYRYDYLLRSVRWLDWYLRAPDRRRAEPPPKDLEYPPWR